MTWLSEALERCQSRALDDARDSEYVHETIMHAIPDCHTIMEDAIREHLVKRMGFLRDEADEYANGLATEAWLTALTQLVPNDFTQTTEQAAP